MENIQFRWPKSSSLCLDITHWQITSGQHVFLYGQSGSGKTTLLNIIAGIIQPENGTVCISDKPITQLSQSQKDRFRAENLGVIFQQFNLIPYLSVYDNVRMCERFSGKQLSHERLMRLFDGLQLKGDLLTKPASQLSVGQQQRVAVARALFHEPTLIIADEPTSALDEDNRNFFIETLLTQAEETRATVLFVSHDKTLAGHFHQQVDMKTLNQVEVSKT